MRTIHLNFPEPFLDIAKRNQMTAQQIIQHLINNLSFCHLYGDQLGDAVVNDLTKDVALIEENLQGLKNDKSDYLGGITLRYLKKIQELKLNAPIFTDELKAQQQQLINEWEEELENFCVFPKQVSIHDHGEICLTFDFLLICMLTGFTIEQALQAYCDGC